MSDRGIVESNQAPLDLKVHVRKNFHIPCRFFLNAWLASLVSLVLFSCASVSQAQQAAQPKVTVIHAGHLFDPASGKMLENQDILVRGNKIEQVGAKLAVPAGAREIDLRNSTVLPGFIDVHTHLTSELGHSGYEGLGISAPRSTLTGAKNARITLLCRFHDGKEPGCFRVR